MVPALGADLDAGVLAEGERARLADQLVADVVAELAGDEALHVDQHAVGGLHHHHLGVLEALGGERGGAGLEHGGGDDLLAEQPAGDVDVVDHRVGDHHVAGEPGRDVGVAVAAVEQQRPADPAGVGGRLQGPEAVVVAAHEPDLDQPPRPGRLGLQHPQAGVDRRGQRLLAQHRLVGGQAGQGELLVGEAGRGDQHGLHPVVGDQLVAVGVGAGPDLLGHLLGPLDEHVGDGHHLGVRDAAGQPLNVVPAHLAGTDEADPQGHCASLPTPSLRR